MYFLQLLRCLSHAGKLGASGAVVASLALIGLGFVSKPVNLADVCKGVFGLGISLIVADGAFHSKRGTDMIATGIAEVKEAIPGGIDFPSADPAIRRAESKTATAVAARNTPPSGTGIPKP